MMEHAQHAQQAQHAGQAEQAQHTQMMEQAQQTQQTQQANQEQQATQDHQATQAGQAKQAGQASLADQVQMMRQAQMVVDGLFDPPKSGNGNIIADIFDAASCILGSFVGSRLCKAPQSTEVVNVTPGTTTTTTNTNISNTYQYSYTTDTSGNYHIQITPGNGKAACSYTVPPTQVSVLASTIAALAAQCVSQ